ncbi:hypothetical protein B0H13DRAFT_1986979 [Mycena leptocephala]|nr:hypothetical protein B0H13DRAFT_1986979 [Mycena leptocephala]
MYKQNTTSNECSDQISAESDGLIGSYGIADRDPKRGDINFLSIGPLASFAIAISPPFLPRSTTLGARQSCWHRRGPRHRYAISLEPYTELLNIQSFIPSHFSRCYPITSDCSGGHCPKSPNFSRADTTWNGGGNPTASRYFPLSNLDPNLAHRGLFLSSRTLIHPAALISRFPVNCKHVFCPFLYLISTP